MMKKAEDIIRDYCGDIERRIQACRTRDVAELLKRRLCSELESSCHSSMIKNVLVNHVDKLIEKDFDNTGKNKFLENSYEKK